jgi:hypothetical protein
MIKGKGGKGGEGKGKEGRGGKGGMGWGEQILATALFIGKSLQLVGYKKMLILMFGIHKL